MAQTRRLAKSTSFSLFFAALILMSILSASSVLALKDGLYKPGKLVIAGRRMRCGKIKTLVSSKLRAVGAAVPGMIGLNPRKLRRYPRVVQWMIYTHECGHQRRGASERKADCFAARTGHRQGWLKRSGLRRICKTLRKDRAKGPYPSGKTRCRIMKKCF